MQAGCPPASLIVARVPHWKSLRASGWASCERFPYTNDKTLLIFVLGIEPNPSSPNGAVLQYFAIRPHEIRHACWKHWKTVYTSSVSCVYSVMIMEALEQVIFFQCISTCFLGWNPNFGSNNRLFGPKHASWKKLFGGKRPLYGIFGIVPQVQYVLPQLSPI